jgi:hypothetical protein
VPEDFIAAIAFASAKVPCSIESTPGARRGFDASGAVRVRRDLEAQGMGRIDDRLHLGIGEMLAEPARLLRQHAAGGSDLDEVGTGPRSFPHPRRALLGPGAGIAAGQCFEHFRAEAADVAVAADDRDSGAGRDDPGTVDQPLAGRPAEREADELRRADVANRGEARLGRDARILDADDRRPLIGIDRFPPEGFARLAGQMHMRVDQAWKDGLGREVHHTRPCRRGAMAWRYGADLPVDDGDGGRPERRFRGIGDEAAGADQNGLGSHRSSGQRHAQGKSEFFQHEGPWMM